ncbi:hypothetical protein ACJMK2_032908 [Sinanodonta woodiana]|uniref:Pre-mRNA cleavage complex 2 protein Pcf11 n=1 Tax=Sinanodonta woodiana TaxID=1069815 RepID=A0ABD3X6S4_SINWO
MTTPEVIVEFANAIEELNINSKPQINFLTMLAEDHEQYAPEIVRVIEAHIQKVKPNSKLPAIYLIDSIVKNLPHSSYKSLLMKNIVHTFTSVFEKVDEKTRAALYKVRQTWVDIFPNNKLYGIDVQINSHLDPAWPVTAAPPEQGSIHVNPRFLRLQQQPAETEVNEVVDDDDDEEEEQVETVGDSLEQQEAKMRQELIAKQQELLRLKQQRIDLELAAAKAELEQQQKKNMSSQPQVSIIPHLEEAVPPPASLTLHTNSETGQPIIRDPRMARDPRLARDPRRLTKDVTSSANTPGFVSDIKDPLINDHQPNISQAWGTVNTINMHQHPAHPHIRGMLPQKIPQFQPFPTMDILHQLNTQPPYVAQDIPVHPFVSPLTGDTFTGTVVTPGEPIPLEPSTKTLDNSNNEKKEFAEKEKQCPGLQRKHSNFRSNEPNNKHSQDHKSQTSPGKKTKPDPKHNRSSTKSLSKSKSDTDSSKEKNDNHSNKKRDSKEKIVSDSKDNREPRSSPRLSMSGSGTDDHKNVKDSRSDSKTDIKSKTESKDSKSRIDTELGKKRKGIDTKEDKLGRNLSNDSKGRSRITGKRGRLEDDERSQNGQIRWNSRDRSPIQNSTHLDKEVERGNRKVARENRDLRSRSDSDRYKVSSNTRSGPGSQEKDIPKSPDEDGKKNQGFEEMDISRNENKNENAASVVRIPLKRDLDDRKRESPESPTMEDESPVKKVKLEIPTIPIEGADIVSKIQDDISELFGKEDQDYRSGPAPHADVEKVVALTLQSPSSKGWDKFKANHPEDYAYDIKLKQQRQEAQDTDQRSNMGDTDFRTPMQRTGNLHLSPEFFHRMPCVEGLRVPQALSMENQADILQHAQEQLIAGKITHEQHQTLLKQLSHLMVIQKLQQELSAREAVEKDPLKNLDPRYMSPRDDFDERKMHSPSKMDIQMSPRHEQTSDMFHHQGQLDANESEMPNGYKDKRGKPAFDHSYRPLGKDSPRSDFQDRIVPTNVASSKQHGAQNLLLVDDRNLGRHGSFDVRGRLDLPPDRHLEEMGGPPSMSPHQDWNFDGRGPHPRGPLHDLDERGLPAPHRRGPLLDLPPDRRGPPERTRPHEDWRIPPGERRIPFDDRQVQLDDRRGLFDDRGNLFDDRIGPFDDRRDIPEDRRGLPDIPPDHRGPLDERRGPHDLERRGLPDISDWRGPPDRLGPHSEGPLDRRVPLLEGCGERSIQPFGPHNLPTRRSPTFDLPTRRSPTFDLPTRRSPTFDLPTRRSPTFDLSTRRSPTYERDRNEPPHDVLSRNGHPPPHSMLKERMSSLLPKENEESAVEDPRYVSFQGMGGMNSEEVVIGNRPFEIKVGDKPRKIRMFDKPYTLAADPILRAVLINGDVVYKFGDKVKEIDIFGPRMKLFYHGKPKNLWIEGNLIEVRVDAPPKRLPFSGRDHAIQIDGRDMMILIDKVEKGIYGGPPRFIYIDEARCELRFEPEEKRILIDGKLCELKLNVKIPYVVLEGKIFGIRFDGPDREILIDGHPFLVPLDRAIKVRIGFRPHYIGFGGPCHEVIIDGKWFEVKFGGPPREVKLGNKNITIQLNGPTPDVKFIENWKPQQLASPTRPSVPVGPIGLDLARPPGPHPLMGSQFRPPGLDGIRQQLGLPVPQGMFPPQGPPVPNSMLPQHRPPGPPGLDSLPGVHGIPPPSIAMGPAMQGPMPLMGPRALQPSLLGPGPGSMIQPLQQMLPQLGALGSLPVSVPPLSGVGIPGTSIAYSMPAVNPTPAQPIVDVSSLINKLVAAGILTTTTSQEPAKTETKKEEPGIPVIKRKKKEEVLEVPDMTDLNMAKLKICHKGVINQLYSGIQCSSCGTRFTLDDTDKYREHLDWHFRQNKRDKEEYKVIRCQKWFYGMHDWTQYEEIGDTEEIARSSIFEQMMAPNPAPTAPAQMPFTLIKVPEGTSFIRCPRATGEDKDDLCDTCHEPFEQYWDEDQEEWHLRDALRINEKTYHPICYEDDHELSDSTPSPSDFPVVKPEFETASSNNACDTTLLETPPSVEAKTEAPDMKITMEVKMDPISLTSSDVQPEANVTTAVSQLTIKQEPNIEESVPFVTEQTSVSAAIDIKVENIKQALIS